MDPHLTCDEENFSKSVLKMRVPWSLFGKVTMKNLANFVSPGLWSSHKVMMHPPASFGMKVAAIRVVQGNCSNWVDEMLEEQKEGQ